MNTWLSSSPWLLFSICYKFVQCASYQDKLIFSSHSANSPIKFSSNVPLSRVTDEHVSKQYHLVMNDEITTNLFGVESNDVKCFLVSQNGCTPDAICSWLPFVTRTVYHFPANKYNNAQQLGTIDYSRTVVTNDSVISHASSSTFNRTK